MTDSVEVAITSESSGQFWTVSVWDICTGSQLMTYKSGGICASHALSLVGTDYIVGAELTKPLLHVWPINSTEPTHELRTVCPGLIGALAVSPNGKYIVAGVAEKIHVWQVEAGRLLCVATRHFQPVTCIRFMEDGNHFVSGGQDGMVLVWCLANLIGHDGLRFDPMHSFQSHYLPVKDIYVGNGGSKSRIVSVSVDGTCRVYDFASGKLLLSIIVDGTNLTSVTADVMESTLFLGCNTGDILSVSLQDCPRQVEHHLSEKEKESVFKGHLKTVTALSPSQNATELMSGSADETVRLWHIESKQCLRIIPMKGTVNNAFITFIPPHMFDEKLKPSIVMHRLQRVTDISNEDYTCSMSFNKEIDFNPFNADFEEQSLEFRPCLNYSLASSETAGTTDSKLEIADLQKKNLALYKFATEKIFQHEICRSDLEETSDSVDIDACLKLVVEGGVNIGPVYNNIMKKGKKKLKR